MTFPGRGMTFPAFEIGDEIVYGVFPGGDPRDFRPDDENSDAEIARWYRACVKAMRLEAEGRLPEGEFPPGCVTFGDGSVWDGTGLGLGVSRYSGARAVGEAEA